MQAAHIVHTLMSFQNYTTMSFAEHKKYIYKNNTALIDFHCTDAKPHISQTIFHLCSPEERVKNLKVSKWWHNFILRWTILLFL